jgi:hypothetical protein
MIQSREDFRAALVKRIEEFDVIIKAMNSPKKRYNAILLTRAVFSKLLEEFDNGADIAMIEYWILSGRIE